MFQVYLFSLYLYSPQSYGNMSLFIDKAAYHQHSLALSKLFGFELLSCCVRVAESRKKASASRRLWQCQWLDFQKRSLLPHSHPNCPDKQQVRSLQLVYLTKSGWGTEREDSCWGVCGWLYPSQIWQIWAKPSSWYISARVTRAGNPTLWGQGPVKWRFRSPKASEQERAMKGSLSS